MLEDDVLAARVLATTHEYLDVPSVVGGENPFLDYLARSFTSLGFQVDRREGLCVVDLSDPPRPVMIAHVDRHGAVVAEDGAVTYAAFNLRNGKYGDKAKADERLADAISRRYQGEALYAYDPQDGGRIAYGDIAGARLDGGGRIVFDVSGLPPLAPKTPLAFAPPLDRAEGGFITGQLDNAVSVAALRVAAEYGLKGRIIFTAEEEIGRSADHFLAWAEGALEPTRRLIVLDTSPFDDSAATLAGAVVLRRRDATASFDEDAVAGLEAAARKAGAPIIFKDAFVEAENAARARRTLPPKSLGLTELGRITAQSKGRFTGATLQIPTFNYHSNRESTTRRAIVSMARTLLYAAEGESA